MSFQYTNSGASFNAGWFLVEDEQCVRETKTAHGEDDVYAVDFRRGGDYAVAGCPYGKWNDDGVFVTEGLIYEDTLLVEDGTPVSVVTKGTVYFDRLRLGTPYDRFVSQLEAIGIKVVGFVEDDDSGNDDDNDSGNPS